MIVRDLIDWLPINLVRGDADTEISEIISDSRKAGPGSLFVALPGANNKSIDGHDYLNDAYGRGCRAFLVQEIPENYGLKKDDVVMKTRDTRRELALLSRRFYGYPEKRLKLIALTGTKGKTTISLIRIYGFP